MYFGITYFLKMFLVESLMFILYLKSFNVAALSNAVSLNYLYYLEK